MNRRLRDIKTTRTNLQSMYKRLVSEIKNHPDYFLDDQKKCHRLDQAIEFEIDLGYYTIYDDEDNLIEVGFSNVKSPNISELNEIEKLDYEKSLCEEIQKTINKMKKELEMR